MTLLWFATGVALVLALTAWSKARRATKQLDDLKQMYWELRCQQGELRMKMEQTAAGDPEPHEHAPAPASLPNFVPLASLKR